MTESTPPTHDPDALLADFTDRLLDGGPTAPAQASDAELGALEESVMRLQRAFPNGALDQRTRERLQADFNRRVREARRQQSRPAWWLRQPRQRIGLAIAIIALVILFALVPGFLTSTGTNVQGTATAPYQNVGLFIILGGVLLSLIWLGRRK